MFRNSIKYVRTCIEVNGSHFEHLLKIIKVRVYYNLMFLLKNKDWPDSTFKIRVKKHIAEMTLAMKGTKIINELLSK